MAETIRYQTNGALPPGSLTYIPRAADVDLWEYLDAGEFCYVLAPRQMGKSSLLWQTVGRLRNAGVCVAVANIQAMGDSCSEAEFYEGVIDQLVREAQKSANFKMPFEWEAWWEQQSGPLAQRFASFIRDAFLKSSEARWVIAIDEIDATIKLPFTDSFFTAIRSCHDARPGQPEFRRLSFVLLGVATPDSLIKDRTRTPFNVGRQVDLRPFAEAEALPLAKGLPLGKELNETALKRVMYWTGGQPHLTQDACDALAKQWRSDPQPATSVEAERQVDDLISRRYLNPHTRGDNPHLDYIEKRRVAEFPKKAQLLSAYRKTLNEPGFADSRESGVAAELKISGLARANGQGFLKVANRVYGTVFDEKWVRANYPSDWTRRSAVTAIRIAVVAVMALVLGMSYEFGYRQPTALAARLNAAQGGSKEGLELARADYEALRKFPFYKAVKLWGEFHEKRFQTAIELDAKAIPAGTKSQQELALWLASSARDELDDAPGDVWKEKAKTGWQDFQTRRLNLAIALDEAAALAAVNASSSVTEDDELPATTTLPHGDPIDQQRNAYQLALQAHADWPQPERLAQFFDRRAERAEYAERLEAGVLWRLSSLKAQDTPVTRQAVSHLIGPDYSPLVRTWGQPRRLGSIDSGVAVCQFLDNKTRLLIGAGNELKLCDVATGDVLETFWHENPIREAVLSPDESRVLSWTIDGSARVWQFGRVEPIAVIRHPDPRQQGAKAAVPTVKLIAFQDKGARPPPRILGARFGSSGRRILTIGDDQTVYIWQIEDTMPEKGDSATGNATGEKEELKPRGVPQAKPLQTFKHNSSVNDAQFSRDESRVLTWGDGKTAWLWDVTKPEAVQTFQHNDAVNGAQFSRDESRVLTWSGYSLTAKGTARLWDVTKPEAVQTFQHNDAVNGAQFSRDESRVLTWTDGSLIAKGTARLWDVTKSEAVQTFQHNGSVNGAQFSRDESLVLTWSSDRTARLWDVTKSEAIQTFKHDNPVKGAQFSRDESRVLTWSSDSLGRIGEAWLWDVTKPEAVQTFKHDDIVRGAQFSRDESLVLTWSGDGTARLWGLTKPEAVQTFQHDGFVHGAQFSRDESRVLTWSGDTTAQLWDVTKPEAVRTFQHDGPVKGAQFSRDESRVLTSSDKTVRLWDVTQPEAVQTFQHNGHVDGAQFSRDASRVLTWSDDQTAQLWDVTKPKAIQTFKHDNFVIGAQFSRDESHVLTWSYDQTARLWDVTKSEAVQTFYHGSAVMGAQFNRDASRVLTWSSDEMTAWLWDVTQPQAIRIFKHGGPVKGAQFSRDASRVLTWGGKGEVRLWDVTQPEAVRIFKHGGPVKGAQFSRDESHVLTWSYDQTMRLWDVTQPEAVQTFKHGGFVFEAQFSRDERHVLTRTYLWLHQAELDGSHRSWSRRLSGSALNEPKWGDNEPTVAILQNWPGGGSVSFQQLRFDGYDNSAMEGEPALLLKEWRDKLGVQINPAGDVVPLRPFRVRFLGVVGPDNVPVAPRA